MYADSDVLVFGFGAFARPSTFAPTFGLWRRELERRFAPKPVLWLDYFSGHFATADGEFVNPNATAGLVHHAPCRPLADESLARRNVITQSGRALAREAGWAVLPMVELSLPAHDNHPGSVLGAGTGAAATGARPESKLGYDCRHWCLPGYMLEARCDVLASVLLAAHAKHKRVKRRL